MLCLGWKVGAVFPCLSFVPSLFRVGDTDFPFLGSARAALTGAVPGLRGVVCGSCRLGGKATCHWFGVGGRHTVDPGPGSPLPMAGSIRVPLSPGCCPRSGAGDTFAWPPTCQGWVGCSPRLCSCCSHPHGVIWGFSCKCLWPKSQATFLVSFVYRVLQQCEVSLAEIALACSASVLWGGREAHPHKPALWSPRGIACDAPAWPWGHGTVIVGAGSSVTPGVHRQVMLNPPLRPIPAKEQPWG